MKKALITGITGQDGYYLAKLLLEKGYEVHGIKRRTSLINTTRIDELYEDPHIKDAQLFLHYGDATDGMATVNILNQVKPSEIYNLAAQSHVRVSFDVPEYTADTVGMGTLRLLDALRSCGMGKEVRFYQASSSEMFGAAPPPQNEGTAFYPRSPYAVSKCFAHWMAINYREAYDMFVASGILFNHESPWRGETFVTRKIAMAVARIKKGSKNCVYMGNLDAVRDWGHARDYVRGMHLMLQHHTPDDFVLATGRSATVRFFMEQAFACAGMEIVWEGQGLREIGTDKSSGKTVVRIDERYFRPTEVENLRGDYSKAKRELGWQPSVRLEELIEEMVESELRGLS